MVLRSKGDVLTFHIKDGQAIFQSVGDTAGDRYREFKCVVENVILLY
jgi:hypothetical protein